MFRDKPVREGDPRHGFAALRRRLQGQLQTVDHQPRGNQDLQRLFFRQRNRERQFLFHHGLPFGAVLGVGCWVLG
jgi:hypothetical protein